MSTMAGLAATLEAEAADLIRRADRPTDARKIALGRIVPDLVQRRVDAFLDAEETRRRAAEHRAKEPEGLAARLSGNRARWQAEQAGLDQAVEEADGRLVEARAAVDRALAAFQREAFSIVAANRAANVSDKQRACGLRKIVQAIRAAHMPTIACLAQHQFIAHRGSNSSHLRHLSAVANQPGFFVALEGADPDAAARFLRQWSAQMAASPRG